MKSTLKRLAIFLLAICFAGVISGCGTSDSTSYTITFVADGTVVGSATYTEKNKEITEPSVPAKDHYAGVWEEYTLDSGDITVNAVYTTVEYTITFVADGTTVDTFDYTVEDTAITEPTVPAKDHYAGEWEAYALDGGNKTVNAIYTAVEYAITFMNGDDVVEVVKFSVDNNDKQPPAVPEKKGYTGVWGAYNFSQFENQTCNLNYEANTYEINYNALGGTAGVASQTVVYDAEYTLTTATPSKDYQDFLGWQDEDGNMVSDGIWTTDSDVTLTAVYSKGLTFETWSDVNTDYMWADGTAGTAVIATEQNGNKCLKIPVNGVAPKLKVTLEFLAMFFEDENVKYVAFDAKTDITSTGNFRRYTWDSNKNELSYVTYEFNGDNFGIRPGLWKSFYFTRADYQTWVDNNFVSNEFITTGNFTAGDNIYVDNIRPITDEEYLDDIYGFEGGWLRLNGTNLLYYIPTNASTWELRVLFYEAAKEPSVYGFTNVNASHGKSAVTFTKPAGKYGFGFNGSGTAKNSLLSTGYYAFDLYVPADSDAILYETSKDYAVGTPKAGAWTTIYVSSSSTSPIYFIDTTGGTYFLDHFRSVTEEEFYAALFSFEAGAGALRDNISAENRFYYYAGADYTANRWSIYVRSDGTTLSDPHFDDTIVHDGDVSLAFTKTNGGLTMAINSATETYTELLDGFTFWIYSTVGLNGTTADNFVNGYGQKLNGGEGLTVRANTWTQITISADDIDSGRFLQINGSTAGTIYIDGIEPLS